MDDILKRSAFWKILLKREPYFISGGWPRMALFRLWNDPTIAQ